MLFQSIVRGFGYAVGRSLFYTAAAAGGILSLLVRRR